MEATRPFDTSVDLQRLHSVMFQKIELFRVESLFMLNARNR
jgi:hypothetical protein